MNTDTITFAAAGWSQDDYLPSDTFRSPLTGDNHAWHGPDGAPQYLAEPMIGGGYTLCDDDNTVVAVADNAVGIVDCWRNLTRTRAVTLSGASILALAEAEGYTPASTNDPEAIAFANPDNTVLVYLEWAGCWGRATVTEDGPANVVLFGANVQGAFYGAA